MTVHLREMQLCCRKTFLLLASMHKLLHEELKIDLENYTNNFMFVNMRPKISVEKIGILSV